MGRKILTVVSKVFEVASVAGALWLMIDAWILGDYGPDKLWYCELAFTGACFGIAWVTDSLVATTKEYVLTEESKTAA